MVLRRLRFYASGWALLGLSAAAIFIWSTSAQRAFEFRIPPERILAPLGALVLALTVVAMIAASIVLRRWRYSPGIAAHALVATILLSSGLSFRDGLFGETCGKAVGCFFLSDAGMITDTGYKIWHAPDRGSPLLWRVPKSRSINYSEDGSYTSDPHLLLSNDEQILVLARGGYLVDAIDLASGRVLSDFIGWGEPHRDALMRQNSDAIAAIAASLWGLADR